MTTSIKVKCFNGKSYDVDVSKEKDTVADLQERIASLSDIAAERQTLLFKGKVLDPSAKVSEYPVEAGVTISVVRRVGGKPTASSASKSSSNAAQSSSASSATAKPDARQTDKSAASSTLKTFQEKPKASATSQTLDGTDDMPDLSGMAGMAGMPGMAGMAGMAGMPGMGGMPPGGMPDMQAMEMMMRNLGMAGAGGLGDDTLGAGSSDPSAQAATFENLMKQMPAVMNNLVQSPVFQEYLNDPSKQEASRDAIVSNPMMKTWLESDPEFAKVVSDPEQWRRSMEAAKDIFAQTSQQSSSEAGGDMYGADDATLSSVPKRPSAADVAPSGINIPKLSESYGHALGQSLVNSGLGLDPQLVMKGFKSACDGKPFPMALPDYERSMAQLQEIAAEYLQKANLEDADQFFAEIKEDNQMVIIEPNKIAYERGEVEPDPDQPVALADATVLVILTARLLDGRHFFTCPAADESGETVHPLTLPLSTAPPALAAGIKGMRETEARLLYVHPSAADGMTEMFGDLLPPNALLIFDLQLVSANAPDEETETK